MAACSRCALAQPRRTRIYESVIFRKLRAGNSWLRPRFMGRGCRARAINPCLRPQSKRRAYYAARIPSATLPQKFLNLAELSIIFHFPHCVPPINFRATTIRLLVKIISDKCDEYSGNKKRNSIFHPIAFRILVQFMSSKYM